MKNYMNTEAVLTTAKILRPLQIGDTIEKSAGEMWRLAAFCTPVKATS